MFRYHLKFQIDVRRAYKCIFSKLKCFVGLKVEFQKLLCLNMIFFLKKNYWCNFCGFVLCLIVDVCTSCCKGSDEINSIDFSLKKIIFSFKNSIYLIILCEFHEYIPEI